MGEIQHNEAGKLMHKWFSDNLYLFLQSASTHQLLSAETDYQTETFYVPKYGMQVILFQFDDCWEKRQSNVHQV